jgi:RNA polymerase sigma factor (sigma-70 family)
MMFYSMEEAAIFRADLKRALRKLTPEEALLVGAIYESDVSVIELADAFEKTPREIQRKLRRALNKLGKELRVYATP